MMSATTSTTSQPMSREERVIIASLLSRAFEWYDFFRQYSRIC